MGRHQRAPRRYGHQRVKQTVSTRHCYYEHYSWPSWLEGETPELINEVLDWTDEDDDGEGHQPAKVS